MLRTLVLFLMILALKSNAQNHNIIDSTVYLKIGERKIECVKRYLDYKGSSPMLYTYLFEGPSEGYIRTHPHFEYVFIQDPVSGESTIGSKYESDSSHVTKFFDNVEKDALIELLKDSMVLLDTENNYLIKPNFTIEISTEKGFFRLFRGHPSYELELDYELSQLNAGDVVIIRDVNFYSKEAQSIFVLDGGYWRIK